MKRYLMVGCILMALAGLALYANSGKEVTQYSRGELEELFETSSVATLQSTFNEKNTLLSDPISVQDFNALANALSFTNSQPFVFEDKESTISSGIFSNGEPFALLENDDERVLSIQITDGRDKNSQGVHTYHQKNGAIIESFYKSDADTEQHLKLTFEKSKGKLHE